MLNRDKEETSAHNEHLDGNALQFNEKTQKLVSEYHEPSLGLSSSQVVRKISFSWLYLYLINCSLFGFLVSSDIESQSYQSWLVKI